MKKPRSYPVSRGELSELLIFMHDESDAKFYFVAAAGSREVKKLQRMRKTKHIHWK